MLHSKSFCSFTQTGILIVKSAFGLRRVMPSLAILIGTLGLLAGCGVKGPLYMPTYPTAPGTQPAAPAPADEQLQAPDSTLPEIDTPSASPITQ